MRLSRISFAATHPMPASNASRVWVLGLRNPFRWSFVPGTGSTDPAAGDPGLLLLGDVGWSTWEELNLSRTGGENFGWPCYEGSPRNAPWDTRDFNQCESLYAEFQAARAPFFVLPSLSWKPARLALVRSICSWRVMIAEILPLPSEPNCPPTTTQTLTCDSPIRMLQSMRPAAGRGSLATRH